jgi:hypothetical protein
MAKQKRSTKQASATKIIRVGSNAPAPIIKVSTPRAAAPVKRKRQTHRRRSNGVGGHAAALGGILSNETVQMAVGGALYGYAVKSGVVAKLPAIPVFGRTGTAALLLDYWGRHGGGQIAQRAARAAAVIAGYQLGTTGAIQGDYDATTPGSVNEDVDGYGGNADFDPLP